MLSHFACFPFFYLPCQNRNKNLFDAEDFVYKIFSTVIRDLQEQELRMVSFSFLKC